MVGTFKVYYFSNFLTYNTVLLIIVILFVTYSPQPFASGNQLSVLCFYEFVLFCFVFRFHT